AAGVGALYTNDAEVQRLAQLHSIHELDVPFLGGFGSLVVAHDGRLDDAVSQCRVDRGGGATCRNDLDLVEHLVVVHEQAGGDVGAAAHGGDADRLAGEILDRLEFLVGHQHKHGHIAQCGN